MELENKMQRENPESEEMPSEMIKLHIVYQKVLGCGFLSRSSPEYIALGLLS